MATEYGVRLPTWRVPIALTLTGVGVVDAVAAWRRHPADSSDRQITPMRMAPRALRSFTSEGPLEISLRHPERQERLPILVACVGHGRLFLQDILEPRRLQWGLVEH